MSQLLVPRATVMELVACIDDAIDRLIAVPGCDTLDSDGVTALVDLLNILSDCASDQRPDGGGQPFKVVSGGLKRAA